MDEQVNDNIGAQLSHQQSISALISIECACVVVDFERS